MELNKKVNDFFSICNKYRYVILVIVIGIALLIFPASKDNNKSEPQLQGKNNNMEENLEERLSAVLRLVDGAGDVRVILSIAAGEEVVYQTNINHNTSDNTENIKHDTVMVSSVDRSTTGLVKQIIPMIYKGAVVICNGADDPVVRLSIVEAISKLTGLGANQISVLKMK